HYPLIFSPYGARDPANLPSFPTRRSSDLIPYANRVVGEWQPTRQSGEATELAENPLRTVSIDTPEGSFHLSDGSIVIAAITSCTDRKSTRLNSSHVKISYAVSCLKKKILN